MTPLILFGNDDLGSNGDSITLFGGAGDDRLYAGGINSYLDGEEGNNQLVAVGGSNELFAGSGNDMLWADGWMREAANDVRYQEERKVA